MAGELEIAFDDLVLKRQQLYKFCRGHVDSLSAFQDGVSFKLNRFEEKLERKKARHLSSSATCIESLLACPPIFRPKSGINVSKLANEFAVSALKRPARKWTSDGSAPIYCRCRTLPLVVRHAPEYDGRIREHLDTILLQLKRKTARLAIGEAPGDVDPDDWYPSNAFHTYWTLYLLLSIEQTFPAEFRGLCNKFRKTRYNVPNLRDEMLIWAQQAAGYQVALHTSESSMLDSDQLAWSLAILITFGSDFQANLAQQDFIRCGLRCLFEHQTSAGIWRTGAPLFHYEKSGNA